MFRRTIIFLGIVATAGLICYGLVYSIVMPEVSPAGFVPVTPVTANHDPAWFGTILSAFILIYAFAFLPVNIIFTVKKYETSPYALLTSCTFISISLILEIINNLPVLGNGLYPGTLVNIPADVLLYLHQTETISYLSYDVPGFTLLYAAIFIYALAYFRTNKLLSLILFGSIIMFILNIPFLWIAPKAAVIIMAASIFACAVLPVFQAKMAVEKG